MLKKLIQVRKHDSPCVSCPWWEQQGLGRATTFSPSREALRWLSSLTKELLSCARVKSSSTFWSPRSSSTAWILLDTPLWTKTENTTFTESLLTFLGCEYLSLQFTCSCVVGQDRMCCWFYLYLSLWDEAPQSQEAHEPACTKTWRKDEGQHCSFVFLPARWSPSLAPRAVGGWGRGEKAGWISQIRRQ